MDNYTDFHRSKLFMSSKSSSYQVLPPACCILDQKEYPPYFKAVDSNCLTTPTSYNSYFLKVGKQTEVEANKAFYLLG